QQNDERDRRRILMEEMLQLAQRARTFLLEAHDIGCCAVEPALCGGHARRVVTHCRLPTAQRGEPPSVACLAGGSPSTQTHPQTPGPEAASPSRGRGPGPCRWTRRLRPACR